MTSPVAPPGGASLLVRADSPPVAAFARSRSQYVAGRARGSEGANRAGAGAGAEAQAAELDASLAPDDSGIRLAPRLLLGMCCRSYWSHTWVCVTLGHTLRAHHSGDYYTRKLTSEHTNTQMNARTRGTDGATGSSSSAVTSQPKPFYGWFGWYM